MTNPPRERATLFAIDGARAVELRREDAPRLQAFFDANPKYFVEVLGAPPSRDQGREEFDALPSRDFPQGRMWTVALEDDAGHMIGMTRFVADLFAAGVWHVAFFVVASDLHGRGVAEPFERALCGWMRERGARWVRLGVVQGNARAERFWERRGYIEARVRRGVTLGVRMHDIRCMTKPLAGGTLADYLALVPRDRVDAP